MRWTAIGLLNPHWHGSSLDGQSYDVSMEASYEPVPEWLGQAAQDDFVREEMGQHANQNDAFCLCVRYDAAPLEMGSLLDAAAPEHLAARRSLEAAVMMLWLAKRTSFGYDKILVACEEADGWSLKEISSVGERYALPSYHGVHIEPEDFAAAYRLSRNYSHAGLTSTVRMACHSVGMARTQLEWPLRYMSHWLALEGLFGPADGREISFRLAQRMALFDSPRGPDALDLFRKVKESYSWRSKIVHGLRLGALVPTQSVELLETLEALVHRLLHKIISDVDTITMFNSRARERYLDELAFR